MTSQYEESPWDFGRHIEFGDALDFLTRDEPFYDNPFTKMIPPAISPIGDGTMMIPPAKISRRSLPVLSKSTTIHDLPDDLLLEVLCRLGHNKVIGRCKLVSKLWHTALSDTYCVGRFLQQKQQQNPLIDNNGYVMVFSYRRRRPLDSNAIQSFVTTTRSKLLSYNIPFMPSLLYFRDGELQVVATYNDLLLCSLKTQSSYVQTDYYICNPHNKDWVRLPPTPRFFKSDIIVSVGFICDKPYYNFKDIDSPSSIIKLNHKFRFRVVRLIPKEWHDQHNKMEYYVEIFSSETGEWREYPLLVVLSPQQSSYGLSFHAIACNGKLYWCSDNGFVLGFNPFNIITTSTSLHDRIDIIDPPPHENNYGKFTVRIGMCQGHMRMCKLFTGGHYVIWELKPQNQEPDGKPEWSLIKQQSYRIRIIDMLETQNYKFTIVGFHPFDGDILLIGLVYLEQSRSDRLQLVMCNFRDKTVAKVTNIPFDPSMMEIFPFVIPWWPTPITYTI